MSTQAYDGDEKIVFAIDCGTTMSAVSFAHLLPGVVPVVQYVNRWPFQEDAAGNCKVPSAVRYDRSGTPIAFGAGAVEEAEMPEGTSLAYWFKLLLHPSDMRMAQNLSVPPLPRGVALSRVYADFLRFLFSHARDSFQGRTPDGPVLWQRLRASFELVLAIPNGWSGAQQAFLREAVVAAGILPRNFASHRLAFVPESEASVHFALDHMNVAHWLRVGVCFAVLDAGGSTVDTTIYRCTALVPRVKLVEVTSSECVQAGSVFVDRAFERIVRGLLAGAERYITEAVSTFESKGKRGFTGQEDYVLIKVGLSSDYDRAKNIKMGRLTVSTPDMRKAFAPAVTAITASVARILDRADVACENFLLVGGFAESPYLRAALQQALAYRGITFVFSDEPTRKAAAGGACSWQVKQYVTARAARCTYGVSVYEYYDPTSSLHFERRDTCFVDPSGKSCIPGFFETLVLKNTVIRHDEPVSQIFWQLYEREPNELQQFTVDLLVTDSERPGPWAKRPAGQYCDGVRVACKLQADLSGLRGALTANFNAAGHAYWQIEYWIEIFFGRTTLCAALVWEEQVRLLILASTIHSNGK
ncbi:hypothetical protein AURDEDRAFT_146694 [Auricularia subglabra TFB-10046 SS5]|nr:hypothetical protein AURDEDRAFT_146694 [Auricularia subglabra TFB-10046 SS5]